MEPTTTPIAQPISGNPTPTPTPVPTTKLSVQDFATKIKAKYPGAYDNVPDAELTQRVIAKYPVYKNQIDLNATSTSDSTQLPADQKSAQQYNPSFAAKTGDNPIVAGAKALGNVPSSLFNLGKNLVNVALHPIKTTEAIGKVIGEPIGALAGYGVTAAKEKLGLAPKGATAAYDLSAPTTDAFVGALKDRYGSLENLQRTATNDPTGFGLDVLTLLQGGATIADNLTGAKTAQATAGSSYVDRIGKTIQGGLNDPEIAQTTTLQKGIEAIQGDLRPNLAARGLSSAKIKEISALDPSKFSSVDEFTSAAKNIIGKDQGYFNNILDTAVSKAASPVTGLGNKVIGGAKKLGAQILGASTGTGASSIETAAKGTPEFIDAMRGKTNPDEVVQNVQDAVDTIKQNRSEAYKSSLAKIGEDTKVHDISGIQDEVSKQLDHFGVKVADDGTLDFSRSSIANNGTARGDIQGVYDTVKNWGTQPGDTTGLGIDTLKKQLGDFYTPSGSGRAFVQAVKSKVSNLLNTEVPGYTDLTKNYQNASNLLDDIKSATGVGGKAKIDTVFTKLTTAMKGDKELRLEVLNSLQEGANNTTILDKIGGINMQGFIPKGLVGKGVDITTAFSALRGAFNPAYLPILLSTSPRVVGEFLVALGWTSQKVKAVTNVLNTIAKYAPAGAGINDLQNASRNTQPQKPLK